MKKRSWTLIAASFLLFETQAYGQWVQTNNPFDGEVLSLAASGSTIFVGTSDGVFLSTDNGTSWNASGLSSPLVNAFAVNGEKIFAGIDDDSGGIFLSTNNGADWTSVSSGLTDMRVLSLAVSGGAVFAGTGGGVFLSFDNGTSWNTAGLSNTAVYTLAVSNGAIFAGTDFFSGTNGGVFLSADSGTSWNATGLTNTHVMSLAVSGGTIFAGTNWGVVLTTDNGTSWNTTDLALGNFHSLAVSGGAVFAGTDGGGVFLTTDNGTSWNAVDSGLPKTSIYTLAVSGGSIFAQTKYDGVWRRPLSDMIGSTNVHTQRDIMNQVHFNIGHLSRVSSFFAIEFTIPFSYQVAITVCDWAGKAISSLVNQHLNAGSYQYFWDTHAFARGCYAVRMRAGTTTCIKTVQIVK